MLQSLTALELRCGSSGPKSFFEIFYKSPYMMHQVTSCIITAGDLKTQRTKKLNDM